VTKVACGRLSDPAGRNVSEACEMFPWADPLLSTLPGISRIGEDHSRAAPPLDLPEIMPAAGYRSPARPTIRRRVPS
jgi:hypothetical protein